MAVQQTAPAVKRVAHKSAAKPKAPRSAVKAATVPAAKPAGMIDCAPAVPLGALGMEPGISSPTIAGGTPFFGGGYGGGGSGGGNRGGGDGGLSGNRTPVPLPGVPEPASWGLMVSGFGLIGLAIRRERKPENA
ncbi:MAG: PEPxxWA-CTERM sorting domain-containing protein [Sphingomonadaceae bacterium]